MSTVMEEEIKRWTAKRKSALVIEILQGKTTVAEASRAFDLPPSEIEGWADDAKRGMENALRTNPLDMREQYEKQLKEVQEAYGEAMLELRDGYAKQGSSMSQYQITVLVGSLRQDSINRKLANAFNTLAPADFSFKQLPIGDLPHYNEDKENDPPESVQRLKQDVSDSQGLIFVTPEYNRSIPGVLKNAIDHGSRPAGQNVWAGKPTAIIGASDAPIGTVLAQQHLRNILAYLDVPVMSRPDAMIHIPSGFFDQNGNFTNSDSRKFMLNWMDEFVFWVKSHNR